MLEKEDRLLVERPAGQGVRVFVEHLGEELAVLAAAPRLEAGRLRAGMRRTGAIAAGIALCVAAALAAQPARAETSAQVRSLAAQAERDPAGRR